MVGVSGAVNSPDTSFQGLLDHVLVRCVPWDRCIKLAIETDTFGLIQRHVNLLPPSLSSGQTSGYFGVASSSYGIRRTYPCPDRCNRYRIFHPSLSVGIGEKPKIDVHRRTIHVGYFDATFSRISKRCPVCINHTTMLHSAGSLKIRIGDRNVSWVGKYLWRGETGHIPRIFSISSLSA